MRWLDGLIDAMDMSKLWDMLRDRVAWQASVFSPWDHKESDTTW